MFSITSATSKLRREGGDIDIPPRKGTGIFKKKKKK
jgi:hypothetical protein